jgi:hypothetical protein
MQQLYGGQSFANVSSPVPTGTADDPQPTANAVGTL